MQSLLYRGKIQHRRHSPKPHAFSYKLFMPYLNLRQLDSLAARMWCLSLERFNLASYRRSDHYGDQNQPLEETICDTVAAETGIRPDGDVMMLAHLAYCGYALNPISLFFCHNAANELSYIVAEVHNTPWGEHCCYVLPITGDAESTQVFDTPKAMHVSPFMPMTMDYRWRIRKTASRLIVHIENWSQPQAEDSPAEKVFDATLTLAPKPLTTGSLLSRLLLMPLATAQVALGIYWQAFRLWLKKTPYVPHPKQL